MVPHVINTQIIRRQDLISVGQASKRPLGRTYLERGGIAFVSSPTLLTPLMLGP